MRHRRTAIGKTMVVVGVMIIVAMIAVSTFVLLGAGASKSLDMTGTETTARTSTSSLPPTTIGASSNSTQIFDESCATDYNGFGSAYENQTYPSYPVLSMPVNSAAVVCLAYHNPTNSSKTVDVGGIEVGYFSAQPVGSGIDKGYNISFNQSSDFTVTPNSTSIVLSSNESQTIAYLIRSDAGSKGFFYLDAGTDGNESCSIGLPIAVGYIFTDQNRSGAYFNPEGAEPNCVTWTPPMVYSTILGFIGIEQSYVDCGGWICDQSSSQGTFAPSKGY